MFKKILIANRGEVAMRVIVACRELGIKTVAVYSEVDESSLHVRFADEEVCIGPPRSAESYLSVPAIISAAEISGADPFQSWYHLGDNSGLVQTFTDTSIVDGIDYTYTITAYDRGVRGDTLQYGSYGHGDEDFGQSD